jgi:hypothetical protein
LNSQAFAKILEPDVGRKKPVQSFVGTFQAKPVRESGLTVIGRMFLDPDPFVLLVADAFVIRAEGK